MEAGKNQVPSAESFRARTLEGNGTRHEPKEVLENVINVNSVRFSDNEYNNSQAGIYIHA